MRTRNANRRRNATRLGSVAVVAALAVLSTSVDPALAQETGEQEQDEAKFSENATAVFVTVENNNWSDMRLYALRNGIRYRLGTVVSFTEERFQLPRHLQPDIEPVQLLATPIGGTRSVRSYPVYLSEGEELVWTLQNNLALSGVILN